MSPRLSLMHRDFIRAWFHWDWCDTVQSEVEDAYALYIAGGEL